MGKWVLPPISPGHFPPVYTRLSGGLSEAELLHEVGWGVEDGVGEHAGHEGEPPGVHAELWQTHRDPGHRATDTDLSSR